VTNSTIDQFKEAKLSDNHQYGKIIKDMKNAVLRKKDPFPKSVNDAWRHLTGRHNYCGGASVLTEANNGVAF